MTNLALYTQIAQLVKGWAEKLDSDAMLSYSPAAVALVEDMRAFGNGLEHTVDTFAPIVAKINEAVAEANDIPHNRPVTVKLRDTAQAIPSLETFAQRTVIVAPGTETLLHFVIPTGLEELAVGVTVQ